MPASFFFVDGARSASGRVRSDDAARVGQLDRLERERHVAAPLGGLGRRRLGDVPVKRTPDGTASTPSIRTGLVDSAVKASPARAVSELSGASSASRSRVPAGTVTRRRVSWPISRPDDPRRLLRHEAAALAGHPRPAAEAGARRAGGQQRGEREAEPTRLPAPARGAAAGPDGAGRRSRTAARDGGGAAARPAVGAETTVVWPAVAQRLDQVRARGVARGRVLGDRARQDRADLPAAARSRRSPRAAAPRSGSSPGSPRRSRPRTASRRSGTRRARSRARRGRSGRRRARPFACSGDM